MQLRKYRWSRDYESAEEELVAMLAAKKIQAERWPADEDTTFPNRVHDADTRLWCAEGMLTVVADGNSFSLQPGDTLDIPAGTQYDITVRLGGCVCYESTHN